MALTAKAVLETATITLQDPGAVRWPLPTLLGWLNDGMKEIALRAPSATEETQTLDLVEGTRQTLPDGVAIMIRPVRNVDGPVVTMTTANMLDTMLPNWHSSTSVPFSHIARHVIKSTDPDTFYVFPGNDGTGQIEASVSIVPDEIAVPGADDDNLDSYTAAVPMAAIYKNALVDYVLYRAFSVDMQMAGNGERAIAHYNQFQTALGLRPQIERVATDEAGPAAETA